MTAPERDEFEVTDSVIERCARAFWTAYSPMPIEDVPPEIAIDLRAGIRAVAPLIRAEGFRQGVEAAAKRAQDSADLRRMWAKNNSHSAPLTAAAYDGQAVVADQIVQAILALVPNQPDASERTP